MAKKPGLIDVKVRMTRDIHRKIQKEAERVGQTLNAEILKRLDDSFELKRVLDKVLGTLPNLAAKMGRVIDDVKMLEEREPRYVEKLARRFNLPADDVKAALDSVWEEHRREVKNEQSGKQELQPGQAMQAAKDVLESAAQRSKHGEKAKLKDKADD